MGDREIARRGVMMKANIEHSTSNTERRTKDESQEDLCPLERGLGPPAPHFFRRRTPSHGDLGPPAPMFLDCGLRIGAGDRETKERGRRGDRRSGRRAANDADQGSKLGC
jgi:hypothetical protein